MTNIAQVQTVRPGLRSRWLGRSEAIWGVLLALPAILGFLFLQLGPMIGSLVIAFTDWTIAGTPHWIGPKNFVNMWHDPLFWQALRVTAYYVAGSVPLRMLAAFLLAMTLNQKVRGLPVFRTIFYLPTVIPLVATAVIWLWMFNPEFGLINAILRPLGFPKILWIFDKDTVIPSFIVMSIWDVGGLMVIFLAGLQNVPRELLEAVEVDGGSWWHRFWYVTIPMMTPTIFFNLVITIIAAFQVFAQVYVMKPDGGPANASLVYALRLYRVAFLQSRMGYASALGWVLFMVIAAVSVVVFRTSGWVYYEEEGR